MFSESEMNDSNEDYQSEDSFDLDKLIKKNRDEVDRDSVDTMELLKCKFIYKAYYLFERNSDSKVTCPQSILYVALDSQVVLHNFFG